MEKYYMVSESELKELFADSMKLCALECNGVDNWEWYGENFQRFINNTLDDYEINDDTIHNFSSLAGAVIPFAYPEVK